MKKQRREVMSGYWMLLLGVLVLLGLLAIFGSAVSHGSLRRILWMVPTLIAGWLILSGLFMVHPNQAQVAAAVRSLQGHRCTSQGCDGPTHFTPIGRFRSDSATSRVIPSK